jgi:hypothetical protein
VFAGAKLAYGAQVPVQQPASIPDFHGETAGIVAAKFLGLGFSRAIIRGFEGPGTDDLVAPGQEVDPVRPHVPYLVGTESRP